MKITSYNFYFGDNTNNDNHWQRLNKEFQPDINLRTRDFSPRKIPPEEFAQFQGCVHSNVHHGKWGSAILSRKHNLESAFFISECKCNTHQNMKYYAINENQ